jgi:hypothetical protein
MEKDREFEMKLLKRCIKDYKRTRKKKEKSEILSKYCELTGISREAAKKRFQRFREDANHSGSTFRGRKRKYKRMHQEVIHICWEVLLCPCAERLHPVLPETIEQLKKRDS